MAGEIDTGNAGTFWRTYKGKYSLLPADGVSFDSTVVMLATMNDVQFTGDATCMNHAAYATIATLASECWPTTPTVVSVPALVVPPKKGYMATLEPINMFVDVNGEVMVRESGNIKLFLNGVSFNIASNFYKE